MPTPTIEETAYTVVGLNVLVADKAIDVITDVRTQVTDRLGPVGENISDAIARAEKAVRQAGEEIDVNSELDKARKQARKQVSAWRKSVDPVAERFESNLPGDVASFLASQRTEAWKVVGATKPAAKTATKPAAKTATKTAAKPKAKTAARKPAASRSTAK